MLGVQQLAPAVEHPHRPGEQPEAPGAELLGDPVLVEEREGELPGAVGDDGLGDAAAAPLPRLGLQRARRRRGNARQDRDLLADLSGRPGR